MHGSIKRGAIALVLVCAVLSAAKAVAEKTAAVKPNRVEIAYVEPKNPAHRQIYEVLKQRRVLERFQTFLSPLRLPTALMLKTDGCDGESNAWYEEADHTVTVCYEYIYDVVSNAPDMTTSAGVTPRDAVVGPTVEVFLHEVAHAIFDLLKVPILGREEDAADQVADYFILHLDDDIARQVVEGVAYMYAHEMKDQTPGQEQFANVHGVSAQRFFNLLCMAHGKDPKLFADLTVKGYLPASRAESCGDEYNQVDYAFRKLIYPYIDQARAKKTKTKKLIGPVQQ